MRPEFCIVTYFEITTYLVYVCYMIVAIKPMYFVMYKIIYFCWKTFSVKSQYHNTKYMYHNHNLHSSASWNFLFQTVIKKSKSKMVLLWVPKMNQDIHVQNVIVYFTLNPPWKDIWIGVLNYYFTVLPLDGNHPNVS